MQTTRPNRASVVGMLALVSVLCVCPGSNVAAETIHILALRVEFPLEDPDDFTSGGLGVFDMRSVAEVLSADADSAFRYPYDPPPHDAQFLDDHLRALAHYVEVASRGELDITWEIFPPDPADSYVAPRDLAWYGSGSSDEERLRRWVVFLKDALDVHRERLLGTGDVGALDRFNSFLVFNASVTLQDILSTELPPIVLTGAEIASTGVDIPSAVGSAWFMPQQIQIPGGVIGLNGSFAKTFLASLGLPILLNTSNGNLAMGGWTLMDVGSDNLIIRPRVGTEDSVIVLSFVPALPMAWEQMRLGWLEPIAVRSDTTVHLAGLSVQNTDLAQAIKVPITEDEYFLLELRRSSNTDDETHHPEIEYTIDDTSGVWLWPKDGDYDAYTPGSGVLVFHVDEDRIRRWEPDNAINAHINQPGIFLVEADGYRDIGTANALGHPRAREGVGSKNDPFPTTGEKTLYADGTPGADRPISLANDGSETGIEITFAPYGTTGDSVAVTVSKQGYWAQYIGGTIVEGIAVYHNIPTGWPTPSRLFAVAFATADGAIWARTEGLDCYSDDSAAFDPCFSNPIARFPEPVVRKVVLEEWEFGMRGSILVIGATTAIRYQVTDWVWDKGTVVTDVPEVPTVLRTDLDRDSVLHDITWTDAGMISASKNGSHLWEVELGDSLVAPPSVGVYDEWNYGYLYAATRRAVHVISRTGLEVERYELSKADSTDFFTGPPLTTTCGNVAITGKSTIYVFSRDSRETHKTPVPGRISGAFALIQDDAPHAIVATTDGWVHEIPLEWDCDQGGVSPFWGQLYGDGASTNSWRMSRIWSTNPPPSELMPKDRTYLHPNPVGNTEGRLRFYLTKQADVEMHVYNGVGELVWQKSLAASSTFANADNEIVWPGGTKFSSGLYLVRVVARASDGSSNGYTLPIGIAR
jgi:hypothetical protein